MPKPAGLAARLGALAREKGLYYSQDLLRGLEVALGVPHRFVILYGPPGVGKTRLVQLVAEALPAELRLVPVQATWRDGAPLVGTFDARQGRFFSGEIVDLALRASADPETYYLLCLEELSLGDPEAYLATILAALDDQPPRLNLGLPAEGAACGEGWIESGVPLPPNLLLFGTFYLGADLRRELPRKLLDRAFCFEMEFADLHQYLAARQAPFPGREPLLAIFDLLHSHGRHIGYRVWREISSAATGAATVGMAPDALLDQLIKARILPSIQGESVAVEGCLRELVKLLSEEEMRFPETLDKAIRMLEQLELHGYTAAYLS